jgi:Zn-dependent protease
MQYSQGSVALFRPSATFLGLVGILIMTGVMLATSPPDGAVRMLIVVFILSGWLVALCVHEYGHALAGYLGGDHGVAERGALTLDPAAYTDPLMSFGLPLIFLMMGGIPLPGGSVLISRHRLRSRRWHLAVSAGGPLGTLLMLMIVCAPFLVRQESWITSSNIEFWYALAGLGQVLAIALVLNLLPIPPLDGWNIASHWMSHETRAYAANLGYIPLMILFAMFWLPTPFTYAFWDFTDGLGLLLGIPQDWGWWGLSQLELF